MHTTRYAYSYKNTCIQCTKENLKINKLEADQTDFCWTLAPHLCIWRCWNWSVIPSIFWEATGLFSTRLSFRPNCKHKENLNIFSRVGVTIDGWLDLLTAHTRHLELQVITVLSPISILYKSPQHPLSLFPAGCVFISRSLATTSNSGDSSASHAQVLVTATCAELLSTINWKLQRHLFSASLAKLNCTANHQLTYWTGLGSSLHSPGVDPTENTASNNFSIVFMGGFLAIAQISLTCLPAATKQRIFLLAIVA
jgi:hypothetical protein